MALRKIRLQGDAVLEKVCRPITEVGPKIETLIDDMFEFSLSNLFFDIALHSSRLLSNMIFPISQLFRNFAL